MAAMSALRFNTVADLYESFPTAAADIGRAAEGQSSLPFLDHLVAEGAWPAALAFCAYLLPKREAVWWGCQTLRLIRPQRSAVEIEALTLAEAWVREPGDTARLKALRRGMTSDTLQPCAWMALGAGWSGGSIVPPEFGIVVPEPHQTARAVRAGLLIELTQVSAADHAGALGQAIAQATGLATRGATAAAA